jgi:predicted O-methyltransferase YrrM
MTTSLEKAQPVLDRLQQAAETDSARRPSSAPLDPQEKADALQDLYLPVSPEGGKLLYSLVRAARPQNVVEFGTSYGISTIYLAAAVRDNGIGHVYGTEMNAVKVQAAQANLAEAGLGEQATVLAGDALETLAGLPGPIGIALLDGWKELCLPVLRLLEPRLAPGALVIGDDNSFESMTDYVAYVRDPANGYVSVDFPIEDGMEVSCWTGA